VSARLGGHVTLEAQANGNIFACVDGYSVGLGTFSAGAADRARDLRIGLPLASLVSSRRATDKEVHLLVRRLARHGLLEYRLRRSRNDEDQVVIEPQVADYWPAMPRLDNADVLVLSRFAYMRRRGNDMVLESARAGALFKLCNPTIAAAVATLSTPQQIKRLRRQDGFPGLELLALLVDCQILLKIDSEVRAHSASEDARERADDTLPEPGSSARAALASEASGLRTAEGDPNLVLWDFHDLLFHARSTAGRHANPLGGIYPGAGVAPPLPAVRPRWPGKRIDLCKVSAAPSQAISPLAKLLRERRSTRIYDDQRPITLAEFSRFLDNAARVLSSSSSRVDVGDGGPLVAYTVRPYPSAGASYELELYLAVDTCEGLARGFYHYDAGGHSLVAIDVRTQEFEALLRDAGFAMGAPAAPQILITLAARFGRMSWKYSSLAYALILKDVGVLMQTLYLTATDMGLGGCAIGSTNIDLFARMTGIEFHVEGPVGQFALGRGSTSRA
jgi:SagB-type dehydrogenase family enzyme